LQYVLNDWNALVRAIGAKKNGTAIGEAHLLVKQLAGAQARVKKLEAVAEIADKLTRVPNVKIRGENGGIFAEITLSLVPALEALKEANDATS
jgi:hypothetical protein